MGQSKTDGSIISRVFFGFSFLLFIYLLFLACSNEMASLPTNPEPPSPDPQPDTTLFDPTPVYEKLRDGIWFTKQDTSFPTPYGFIVDSVNGQYQLFRSAIEYRTGKLVRGSEYFGRIDSITADYIYLRTKDMPRVMGHFSYFQEYELNNDTLYIPRDSRVNTNYHLGNGVETLVRMNEGTVVTEPLNYEFFVGGATGYPTFAVPQKVMFGFPVRSFLKIENDIPREFYLHAYRWGALRGTNSREPHGEKWFLAAAPNSTQNLIGRHTERAYISYWNGLDLFGPDTCNTDIEITISEVDTVNWRVKGHFGARLRIFFWINPCTSEGGLRPDTTYFDVPIMEVIRN